MRRALLWLLLFLLPVFARAQELPRIEAEKMPVDDAPPGVYAYTLTVRNQGERPLERIFVEESGAMGDTVLPAGAFVSFSGADVLLNQNGTATILRLEPGQEASLRYESRLDAPVDTVQTHCALSAMYADASGKEYLLLASADQRVTLAPAAAQETETPGGGVLAIALEHVDIADAAPGATIENTVTLHNVGTGALSGILLRMDTLRGSQGKMISGAWLDTAGWIQRPDGALEQPQGETLLPGESMVFRCCWTLPEDAATEAEGSVSAWVQTGAEARQDVCAVFHLTQSHAPWTLQLTPEVSLSLTDCLWIGFTLLLCALMAAFFRPGRFRAHQRSSRRTGPGADPTAPA